MAEKDSKTTLTASIAMCTYNGAKYLQQQLDSLAAQVRLPDELVVCDDGSTDDTVRIVNAFAESAPFKVRIFQNASNLGCVKNFEKAALLCEGDVVFFCDQDDIWKPEKIQVVMDMFEADPELGMIGHDCDRINAQGKLLEPKLSVCIQRQFGYPPNFMTLVNQGSIRRLANRLCAWPGHAMAFRTSLNEFFFPIPEYNTYDSWAFLAGISAIKFQFQPQTLVQHRIYCESTSKTDSYNKVFSPHGDKEHAMVPVYRMFALGSQHAADRLQELSGRLKTTEGIRARRLRARHYFRRIEMKKSFKGQIWYSLLELFNGGYFRHSRGFLSFMKDFLGF